MARDALLERPLALQIADGVEGARAFRVSGSARLPLLPDKAVCRHTRLHQFLDVQLSVFVLIQSFEFRFHKLHVLSLGDFARLVGFHNEEQFLDRSCAARLCEGPLM